MRRVRSSARGDSGGGRSGCPWRQQRNRPSPTMLCYVTRPDAVVMEVEVEAKANGEDCLNQVRGFFPSPAHRAPALGAGAVAVASAAVTTGQRRALVPGDRTAPLAARRPLPAAGPGRQARGGGGAGLGRAGAAAAVGAGSAAVSPLLLRFWFLIFIFRFFLFFLTPSPC